jgi:hypothetical protein
MAELERLGARQPVRSALVSVSISLGLPETQAALWKRVEVLCCKKANYCRSETQGSKACMETRQEFKLCDFTSGQGKGMKC